jgi:tetrahydromethanopterin S-methyltransferase subunit G
MERIEEIEMKIQELRAAFEMARMKWKPSECDKIAKQIDELEAAIDAIVSEENKN